MVQTLQRICASRGLPQSIKVDSDAEFVSKAMDRWTYESRVELDFTHPGKPTFNGRLRQE
ncbi:hypothetical protein WJ96_00425 [Burkholderia ubonensis]|uniref:Integrase catalytic domain-containing protein n=2 Tax=Burkholderia ubonensis TaxID=101571 RepID=A0AAW3MPV4_9BURK|nr:hypothetical protein WJ96_00425 [Burkholderia ubonensis]